MALAGAGPVAGPEDRGARTREPPDRPPPEPELPEPPAPPDPPLPEPPDPPPLPRIALLIRSGTSSPVSPFTTVLASVTVRVAFFTTSDAPSLERTVSEPIDAIGSAAARTISGSIERTVWMIAASLNWRYASARSAEGLRLGLALAEARCPASALPSSFVFSASDWAFTRITRAFASPFVIVIAASA